MALCGVRHGRGARHIQPPPPPLSGALGAMRRVCGAARAARRGPRALRGEGAARVLRGEGEGAARLGRGERAPQRGHVEGGRGLCGGGWREWEVRERKGGVEKIRVRKWALV
ncbi:hypothetical protein GUJ93_ZPchr0002g25270 [Zizania palustris]|uniref:Uncharacterized protein n=1 Tax=Zizania palustris TaxID=103762 RepID=A0A8J5S0Y3_ZIZPA|nr:hypothetical protein GUJ93_ZPchr0002g25270 [Zizania palustris]